MHVHMLKTRALTALRTGGRTLSPLVFALVTAASSSATVLDFSNGQANVLEPVDAQKQDQPITTAQSATMDALAPSSSATVTVDPYAADAFPAGTVVTPLPNPASAPPMIAPNASAPSTPVITIFAHAQPPQDIARLIAAASILHDVDARLITAVMAQESGFDPLAISPKGAQGLMQLMPGTARDLGVTDAMDIRQNIDGGVRYLKRMLTLYKGNHAKALAAYNAGPDAVDEYGGIPPYIETVTYVSRITQRMMEDVDSPAGLNAIGYANPLMATPGIAPPVAPPQPVVKAPPPPLLVYEAPKDPPATELAEEVVEPAEAEDADASAEDAVAEDEASAKDNAEADPDPQEEETATGPNIEIFGVSLDFLDSLTGDIRRRGDAPPVTAQTTEETTDKTDPEADGFDIRNFEPPAGMVTVVRNGKAVQ